ncbi:hypothetical protein FHW88_004945 [Mucilaginibacter sp. SG538B]|uniref:hypothetical protein n=1 Tax=Mucilaginibacter sp. SG538B TaxID=2587021 RepID=UPI00159D920F|nr:hypothetical protein [Mucilaginibacter sp. SG538B]NVM66627.1 hypothetical protein [Mucilaginibacter sp. SG538B]
MLKNELGFLADKPELGKKEQKDSAVTGRDFSKLVSECCGTVREAWAAAAFSVKNDTSIRRYFDFHFKFLSGLISQHGADADSLKHLNLLMDDLLLFYGDFIQHQQLVALEYYNYRLQKVRPDYELFMALLESSEINDHLRRCLCHCLPPLYTEIAEGTGTLGDLFYREKLIGELNHRELNFFGMTEQGLVNRLMAVNFNHFLFFQYLQEQATRDMQKIEAVFRGKYLLDQSINIPLAKTGNPLCFDKRWTGICDLYKTWLYEQGTFLSLGSVPGEACPKIPLNISVAYLACLIRAFYDQGIYGAVSLTAIFEHAAKVFTTKRQEHISADSLSNAYYNISQQTAARMIGIFNNASAALKLRYFPV